jgi:hypothetical protein
MLQGKVLKRSELQQFFKTIAAKQNSQFRAPCNCTDNLPVTARCATATRSSSSTKDGNDSPGLKLPVWQVIFAGRGDN